MKKSPPLLFILFLCCSFFISYATAQDYTIDCQVIGSSGTNTNFDNVSFAGTIGEVTIKTIRNTEENITLTQGFHQPECTDAEIINSTGHFIDTYHLNIHGNPISDLLVFEASIPTNSVQVEIVNTLGQVLMTDIPFQVGMPTQVNCSKLLNGMYWLRISDLPSSSEQLMTPFIVAN